MYSNLRGVNLAGTKHGTLIDSSDKAVDKLKYFYVKIKLSFSVDSSVGFKYDRVDVLSLVF